MKRNKEMTAERLIQNRKGFKGIEVSEKQKEEIQKVIDFIYSSDNKGNLLKKQWCFKMLPKMVESGVDNYYVRRLIRKIKYYPGVNLNGMLLLYGRKGYEYWEEYRRKQSYTNTFEYKHEQYGWTKEEFDRYNKNRAVTLENLIEKYGEDKGREVYDEYRRKQAYTNTYEYFVEKFDGDKEKAKKEYDRINRQKSNTFENLMRIYQNEDKVIEILGNKNSPAGVSNISQELFDKIYNELPKELQNSTHYHNLNKEFGKLSFDKKKYFFYDFVISNIKFCIEFNGDDWHANPTKYLPDEVPPIYQFPDRDLKTAKQIWEDDRYKQSTLTREGFKVIYVWESSYEKDKEKTIKKCLEYIYERAKEFEIQW